MATQARGAATKVKNQMMAQRMKDLGIRRIHGLCPVCYRIVAVPMDRHFFGGNCS
jgi:hypothetical protein